MHWKWSMWIVHFINVTMSISNESHFTTSIWQTPRQANTIGQSNIKHLYDIGWIEIVIDQLQSRHNDRDGVSNNQPHDCLLNRLFGRISKETSKLRVTGLWVGHSPVTGEFPAQRAINAEKVSIWWRHHAKLQHTYNIICEFKNFITKRTNFRLIWRRQKCLLRNHITH